MRKYAVTIAMFVGLVTTATSAHAQATWALTIPTEMRTLDEGPAESREQGVEIADQQAEMRAMDESSTEAETKWYGYQIMLADLATLGALFVLPEASLGLYVGGPALVHAVNGNLDRSLISSALRVGLPVGGYLLGNVLVEASGSDPLGKFVISLIAIPAAIGVGLGTALIIDYTLLSRKTVPKKGYFLAPSASVTPAGVSVGLVGQF